MEHNKKSHHTNKSGKTMFCPSPSSSTTSKSIATNNLIINPINHKNDLWREYNAKHRTSLFYDKTKNKLNELISPSSKYSKDVLNSHGDVQTFIESEPTLSAISSRYYLKYDNKSNPPKCDVIHIAHNSELNIFAGSGGNAKGKKCRIRLLTKGKEIERKEVLFYEYGHSDILKLKQPKQGNPYFNGIVSLSVNGAADVALTMNEYIEIKFILNAGKAAKWIDDKKLKGKGRGIFGGNGIVLDKNKNKNDQHNAMPVIILRANSKNGQQFGTETARNSKIEMRLYRNKCNYDGVDAISFEMVKEKKDEVTWKKEFCIKTCIESVRDEMTVSDNNGAVFGANNNGCIVNMNQCIPSLPIINTGHFEPNNMLPPANMFNIKKTESINQGFGDFLPPLIPQQHLTRDEMKMCDNNGSGSSISPFNTPTLFGTESRDKASPNMMNNNNTNNQWTGTINNYAVSNVNEHIPSLPLINRGYIEADSNNNNNNHNFPPPAIPQKHLNGESINATQQQTFGASYDSVPIEHVINNNSNNNHNNNYILFIELISTFCESVTTAKYRFVISIKCEI